MLISAFLWGIAFIAQKLGAVHLGPFCFTGFRFAIGALVVAPLALRARFSRVELVAGGVTGAVMAISGVLQQWGLEGTTAGNGGFITSLYVVIAPFFARLLGQPIRWTIWLGIAIVLPGLWFLSVQEGFALRWGDPLVFLAAIGWAVQILLVSRYSRSVHPLRYAFLQFAIVGLSASAIGVVVEQPTLAAILAAGGPLLFGGIFAVAIAFSLQMIAQRTAPPAHAAIIMSLEAVFALAAGMVWLGEAASARNLLGAGLMLVGVIVAQIQPKPRSSAGAMASTATGDQHQ
jgi:drug/metabolite transporter (DMT)-like permease